MSALPDLTEEEAYLWAILSEPDGLELAEFSWVNAESEDACFRARDYQWTWYLCPDRFQVDQGARNTGKTVGITMRAYAFPFNFPGQKMLLTAPELNHLEPLTSAIEDRFSTSRIIDELRPKGHGRGMKKQPHWTQTFTNGTILVSRLPGKKGTGVKAQHVLQIELDEAQDYPRQGFAELVETLNRGLSDSAWRCHGVPKGVRDWFYDITEGAKDDDDIQWRVHRPMAMMRPSWDEQERAEKINQYGGSRQNIDYKRNIYGEHGDSANAVFVIARLMECVDTDSGSTYNTEVYTCYHISDERLPHGDGVTNEDRQAALETLFEVPGSHFHGYSQKALDSSTDGARRQVEVGAPDGYTAYWGGMDIGVTNHPSEILIFGQRAKTDTLELLLRLNLQRIAPMDQAFIVRWVFRTYGEKLKAFGIDKTGVGFPIWDELARDPYIGRRIFGYNFSEKRVAAFADRELEDGETMKDLAIMRYAVESATDWLRNDYVEVKLAVGRRMRLPYDKEVLLEFQGQTYVNISDTGSPYGTKRAYSGADSYHTLDAAKMMAAARHIPPLEQRLEEKPEQEEVLDVFLGAG